MTCPAYMTCMLVALTLTPASGGRPVPFDQTLRTSYERVADLSDCNDALAMVCMRKHRLYGELHFSCEQWANELLPAWHPMHPSKTKGSPR